MSCNWLEITTDFSNALQNLHLGELLHDELFSLSDAMTAIEMMDPKMDAGMVYNRGIRRGKSFDQAVADGLLKLDDISNEELVGIIDTTLACMVSWLEGQSSAEVIFANLYLHKPYSIVHEPLKIFCLSVYKLLEMVKEFIRKAMVYEDENFQPSQCEYVLNPDISRQQIICMLKELEEDLYQRCRNANQDLQQSRYECATVLAMFARVKFLRIFLKILTILLHQTDGQQVPFVDCDKSLAAAMDMLTVMQNTVPLGAPSDAQIGFDPGTLQKFLPFSIARDFQMKPKTEALQYFKSTVVSLLTVCRIRDITDFYRALDFFIEFSKCNPCMLSRSLLQLLYLGSNTVVLQTNPSFLKGLLREDVDSFVWPPSAVNTKYNKDTKHCLDTFLLCCTASFASLLQICGFNRVKQRNKLVYWLEAFAPLQNEAQEVDARLAPSNNVSYAAYYSTWILYHTVRVMIMYVLSGFELELYSEHEYCYVYWYLHEYLYGWLVSTVKRAEFLVDQGLARKVRKSKGKKKMKVAPQKHPRHDDRNVFYFQALQNMCGGYFKALVGFRIDNKLTTPPSEFDDEKVRFEHRFAPFKCLTLPPLVQYSDFKEVSSKQSSNSLNLYVVGSNYFRQAREMLEILPVDSEIADLILICKTNFIVLKLLASGYKKKCTTPPEFDFSKHKSFPIIKLA